MDENNFIPTVGWMHEKYNEMNEKLFGGSLGSCDFGIFTTGRGSQGGVLGWFKMTSSGLYISRSTRRLYKKVGWNKEFVTRETFVSLCKPTIELNGNYNGTEKGFLETLVHEMCHYYTYMNGLAPTQAHGREFKHIASVISSRSNGYFTVQRVASAEQMKELELNAEMQAKRNKRLENKKAAVSALVVFCKNGEARLTVTSNQYLINMIRSSEKRGGNDSVVTNDADIIEFLFGKGYRKNFRTWRYWNIENKSWFGEFKNMLNKKDGVDDTSDKKEAEAPKQPTLKKVFSIKTSNGTFECDASSFSSLLKALKERFPKMSDEAINKIMNNPANYKEVMESRKSVKSIIREVIEELMNNEFRGANNDDSVAINPDMNLGLQSPMETE